MSSALASLGPGVIFARDFRIVRALAEGGMGAVFVVEQLSSGKLRALKVLSPSLVADPASREQFTLEARIGGQIGSGHIVEVIAAGVDEETDIPYLAMEFLEGEDLADLLHRRGRLPTHEAMEIFEQLGDALAAAHRAGVIHRDIKPRNIFVARSRLRGMPFVVKVLDFGISKLITNNATSVTVTRQLGSPLFMAPEQARSGAKLRRSTDVWPMGLLAYLLLTGRHYWRAVESNGVNLNALLMEIAVHPIEPPGLRALEQGLESGVLPEGFDGWFLRCVERDPERRFADAGEATEALGAVMRERHESMMENEPTVVRALPGRRTSGAFPVAPEARSRIGTPVSQPVPPPTTTMPERPASRAPAAIAAIGPPPRGDFSADTRAAPKRPWMVVAAAGVALVVAALWWRHSHRPSANASGIVAYPLQRDHEPHAVLSARGVAAAPLTDAGGATTVDGGLMTPLTVHWTVAAGTTPDASADDALEPAVATHVVRRATGRLTVGADPPRCEVSVDGRAVGRSPVFNRVVSAGEHRVRCQRPDGRAMQRLVRVPGGRETEVIFPAE